jgi:hypothetical protein
MTQTTAVNAQIVRDSFSRRLFAVDTVEVFADTGDAYFELTEVGDYDDAREATRHVNDVEVVV